MSSPTALPSPSAKVALTRLQASMAALVLVGGGAVSALAARPDPGALPASCIVGVQVWYANEYTTNDTLLYVPPQGTAQRDSLLRADSLPNGAILPDVAPQYVHTPVAVCFPNGPPPLRPVLGT